MGLRGGRREVLVLLEVVLGEAGERVELGGEGLEEEDRQGVCGR